jgi:hypothetical protein
VPHDTRGCLHNPSELNIAAGLLTRLGQAKCLRCDRKLAQAAETARYRGKAQVEALLAEQAPVYRNGHARLHACQLGDSCGVLVQLKRQRIALPKRRWHLEHNLLTCPAQRIAMGNPKLLSPTEHLPIKHPDRNYPIETWFVRAALHLHRAAPV